VLHARIAQTLEGQFPEIAESQPELPARHYSEAGLIEKAANLWGKAGQRSLARSALVEAAAQLTRAIEQIASLPSTPALRREEITLQVALIAPLFHLKGPAAEETKAAAERARLLIEQAEAAGEPPEDPLLLFSVLYGIGRANHMAFNGEVQRELAAQFLALAEKQGGAVPLMIAHRLMGTILTVTGDFTGALPHYTQTLALYHPVEHRSLATRFGQDNGVAALCWRALGLWALGYPEKAIADSDRALKEAREIGQAATLMFALDMVSVSHIICGNYALAKALLAELVALADGRGATRWKVQGLIYQGCVLALTGDAAEAVQRLNSGIAARRSVGTTLWNAPVLDLFNESLCRTRSIR
jgi:tetratricopeptide (TPR) repeat protein